MIPVHWTALQLRQATSWVKILRAPQEGEKVEWGIHCEPLDQAGWAPAQVKYVANTPKGPSAMIAVENDTPSAAQADYIVLFNYMLPIDVEESGESPDLDDVPTPQTPSPSTPL